MVYSSGSWRDAYKGMSSDNVKGLVLALSSSIFIGASFIVKKKGLKKAGASGLRAGSGGYSYLLEPLWWIGMITMIVGEIANFAAYAFAPAILVTPLGALSIIIRCEQTQKLHTFGILGCALCIVGSVTIVLHAPQEQDIVSVLEVWNLATEPGSLSVRDHSIILHVDTYIYRVRVTICVTDCKQVMSVKALGIALKLTFSGTNQLGYPQTWVFTVIVLFCVITQMNYLNKDWDRQSGTQIMTELCGFVTILSGTFLLHTTTDMVDGESKGNLSSEEDSHLLLRIPKHSEDSNGFVQDGIILSLRRQESAKSPRPARQNKQLEDDLEAVPLRRQESSLRS
ncbi:putative protein [Arabidopsis thaliana]|nr:putative protein [Arabidopsis thaliana]CAB82131.1 putative protein [Arabidopsis thaliana]